MRPALGTLAGSQMICARGGPVTQLSAHPPAREQFQYGLERANLPDLGADLRVQPVVRWHWSVQLGPP